MGASLQPPRLVDPAHGRLLRSPRSKRPGGSAPYGLAMAQPQPPRPTVNPISVHVGSLRPAKPAPPPRSPDQFGRLPERPSPFADRDIDWSRFGLEPRWLGMDTADCAAAFDPSIFATRGADELARFRAGARNRGETAIVIATIGDVEDTATRSVFGPPSGSITPPGHTRIHGSRLPHGATAELADDVQGADRDLGLRLGTRPADAPRWRLELAGSVLEGPAGTERYDPDGELAPVLVDSLGHPVVAVWTPSCGAERWYVIPDATDPSTVLDWLTTRCLPEYVPRALRRARSPAAISAGLQTTAEISARAALAELDARYDSERRALQERLDAATARADPVRHGLLFGTGSELEKAVATVLADAGLPVVDLDEMLGSTDSADLLVSDGFERRLVEVKSVSGNAPERLVEAIGRHLKTWPQLRPGEPVGGGVLIVNHQHRLDPDDRDEKVFTREAFVNSLTVVVISTRQLLDWWRTSDWPGLRAAIFTHAADAVPATADAVQAPPMPGARPQRRWWSRKSASG